MKKTIVLLAFVFTFSGAFAQKGKVTSAQNLKDTGKLEKALQTIEERLMSQIQKPQNQFHGLKHGKFEAKFIRQFSNRKTKILKS